MIEGTSRRQTLYGLTGITGLLASESVFSFARKHSDPDAVPGDMVQFLKDAGEARLMRPPQFAVKEFSSARLGSLCFWYQNFWEFEETPGALEEFEKASLVAATKGQFPDRPHRPLMLPAVAHLHSFTNATPSAAEAHSAVVRRVHAAALDPSSPTASREILEGLWQNATAALIRNETSWEYAAFDEALVAAARNLLLTYLDHDAYLLMPAVSAWQFLLTYEISLRGRRERGAQAAVRSIIAEINEHPVGNKSYWFRNLQLLTAGRTTLDQALPQINEVLMSLGSLDRAHLAPRDVVDFFVLLRLEQAHLRAQAQTGYLATPYKWPPRKLGNTHAFLTEYGFQASHLRQLSSVASGVADSRFGPTAKSIRYWEDLVTKPLAKEAAREASGTKPVSAATLAKILPFNRVEANRIMRFAYSRKIPLNEMSHMILKDVVNKPIERFISELTDKMAKAFSTIFPVLRVMKADRQTEDTLQGLREHSLEDLARRVDELKTEQRTSIVVPLPPKLAPPLPLSQQYQAFASEQDGEAFDHAAEVVFAAIPSEERALHSGELVFINPVADPEQGPLYVFGTSIAEILERANDRFGPEAPGELMSLATEDGSVPDDELYSMRCL